MSDDHLARPLMYLIVALLLWLVLPARADAEVPLRLGEQFTDGRHVTWWAGPGGCADVRWLDAQHSCRRLTPSRAVVIAAGASAQALDVLQVMPSHFPVDVVTLERHAQTQLEPVWGVAEPPVDGAAEVQLCATMGDHGGGLSQHLFEACVQRVQARAANLDRGRTPLRWHLRLDRRHAAGPATWRAAVQVLEAYHLIDATTAVVVVDSWGSTWAPNAWVQLGDLPPAHYTFVTERPAVGTPTAMTVSLGNVALVTSPWQRQNLQRVLFQRYRTTTVGTRPASIADNAPMPSTVATRGATRQGRLFKMLWLWYSVGVMAMVIVWYGRQLWFGAHTRQKM